MNKKTSIKIIVSVILAIIIIGVILYILIPKENKTENEKNVNNITQEPIIEEGQQQYSQINLENTENAKVEDGKKINTSDKLLQEKNFNGIIVKDIKLVAQNGITTFTAAVQNNTDKKITAGKITIEFKNSEGIVYSKLNSYIGDIDIEKTGNINANTTKDLANAYDFTIEFNK